MVEIMNYAKYIDHTLLKPNATLDDIYTLCNEAKEYDFMSVCVNPFFVPFATEYLEGTGVKVCTVIGFPLGATFTKAKIDEARLALDQGADEIDMVINIGMLKAHQYQYVQDEIRYIREATRGHILKVIIETCLLTDEEIVAACLASKEAGADFVKTSTGFSSGGATIEAVRLMRQTVGEDMGVKASGGIRTHEDMMKMIEAGANRIGTSAGPKIV